jgi:hypothetical protein
MTVILQIFSSLYILFVIEKTRITAAIIQILQINPIRAHRGKSMIEF